MAARIKKLSRGVEREFRGKGDRGTALSHGIRDDVTTFSDRIATRDSASFKKTSILYKRARLKTFTVCKLNSHCNPSNHFFANSRTYRAESSTLTATERSVIFLALGSELS